MTDQLGFSFDEMFEGQRMAHLPFVMEEPEAINSMLKPRPADWLECVEVSTLVNSPRNNRAEVLEPLGLEHRYRRHD
jgi:hypothetical protein